jgi:hypothetical protein
MVDDDDATRKAVAKLLKVAGNPSDPQATTTRFRAVLLRWIILTEQWPFRMAMTVQQLMDDAQLPNGLEAMYDCKKHLDVNKIEVGGQKAPKPQSEWMQDPDVSGDVQASKGKCTEVPLDDFYSEQVQHYVEKFETGAAVEDGKGGKMSEIVELLGLDSDPEVFDALLSVGMPVTGAEDAAGAAGAGDRVTLAECYAMAKYFNFNLNPAVTSAVERLVAKRRFFDFG